MGDNNVQPEVATIIDVHDRTSRCPESRWDWRDRKSVTDLLFERHLGEKNHDFSINPQSSDDHAKEVPCPNQPLK
jgi:hypothetical protein